MISIIIKLLMRDGKVLRNISPSSPIFENENNADKILVLCSQNYEEYNLSSSSVYLNYIIHTDKDIEVADEKHGTRLTREIGNSTLLSFLDEKYIIGKDEEFLQADVSLTKDFTAYAGQIEFWLEIINEENELIAKTNSVSINITHHKNIIDYICVPNTQLDALTDLMLKIQQLVNTCNITLQECKDEVAKAVDAATIAVEVAEELEEKYRME